MGGNRGGGVGVGLEDTPYLGRRRIFASALLLVALALTCSAGSAFGLTRGHTYSSEFGSGFGTGNGQWAQTYVGIRGRGARRRRIGRLRLLDRHGKCPDHEIHHLRAVPPGLGIRSQRRHRRAPGMQRSDHLPGRDRGRRARGSSKARSRSRSTTRTVPITATSTWRTPRPGSARRRTASSSSAPPGVYLGKINDSESPGSWEGFADRGPIAVDAQGFLWVAAEDHNYLAGGNEAGLVTKFSNEVSNEYLGGSTWDCGCGEIRAMTVNPAGTKVYLTDPNATVASYESDGTARFEPFRPGRLLRPPDHGPRQQPSLHCQRLDRPRVRTEQQRGGGRDLRPRTRRGGRGHRRGRHHQEDLRRGRDRRDDRRLRAQRHSRRDHRTTHERRHDHRDHQRQGRTRSGRRGGHHLLLLPVHRKRTLRPLQRLRLRRRPDLRSAGHTGAVLAGDALLEPDAGQRRPLRPDDGDRLRLPGSRHQLERDRQRSRRRRSRPMPSTGSPPIPRPT